MQTHVKTQIPPGSFTATLVGLFEKGLRYSTVIDVGCADGHFYVYHSELGLFTGSTLLNIDANAIYEPSLKAIKDVMGGHYVIAAASDRASTAILTTAVHPYWGSLRPAGDRYWEHNNDLREGTIEVPTVTLDGLAKSLGLAGPFLLKLDVQGAEAEVLHGARDVLRQTHVVICEVDLDDFQTINEILVDAGFGLFDLTNPNWVFDRSLGWFYPVYLNRSLDRLRPRGLWDVAHNQAIVKAQVDRRRTIREQLARALAQQRAARSR